MIIDDFVVEIEELAAKDGLRNLTGRPYDCLDFSSNDYLCMSDNQEIIAAGCELAKKLGAGSTGSRVVSGNHQFLEDFEEQIAKDGNTQGALIFSSGFMANYGALNCLIDQDTSVFFDKLNHASMYHGAWSSGANLFRYNHLNYEQLEDLLKQHPAKRKVIVSETAYGMYGDVADIGTLLALADKYGAFLFLDESHATGLYGKFGYGVSSDFPVAADNVIIMGSFSKALGGNGAYVASSLKLKKYFINKCSSFVFTTAPSPFSIGAAQHAWSLVKGLGEVRKQIMDYGRLLRSKLSSAGYQVSGEGTNIIPVSFETNQEMLASYSLLRDKQIAVSKRFTAKGPKLKIAVNAKHRLEDLDRLIAGLSTAG